MHEVPYSPIIENTDSIFKSRGESTNAMYSNSSVDQLHLNTNFMIGNKTNVQSHEEIRLLKEPVIMASETPLAEKSRLKKLKSDSSVRTSIESASSFASEEIVDDYIKGVDQEQKPTQGNLFYRPGQPPYNLPMSYVYEPKESKEIKAQKYNYRMRDFYTK